MTENKKYLDVNLSIDERVDDLVSRMSLEMKVAQTLHNSTAIPSLGVPAYNWWNEMSARRCQGWKSDRFPSGYWDGFFF